VYFVEKRNKTLLMIYLLEKTSFTRTLVFTRTKHGADKVARQLYSVGIHAEAIHSNKSQNARLRALANFKSGKTPVLVASDIAARGIDIDEISHVINYDLPNVPETYVHRIGRTARAGASGSAISFCDQEERAYLKSIERLTRVHIAVRDDQPPYPARDETPHHQGRPHGGGRPQQHHQKPRQHHPQQQKQHHPQQQKQHHPRQPQHPQGQPSSHPTTTQHSTAGKGVVPQGQGGKHRPGLSPNVPATPGARPHPGRPSFRGRKRNNDTW
jgi:ATP-dependent RNA helicase RhlE